YGGERGNRRAVNLRCGGGDGERRFADDESAGGGCRHEVARVVNGAQVIGGGCELYQIESGGARGERLCHERSGNHRETDASGGDTARTGSYAGGISVYDAGSVQSERGAPHDCGEWGRR